MIEAYGSMVVLLSTGDLHELDSWRFIDRYTFWWSLSIHSLRQRLWGFLKLTVVHTYGTLNSLQQGILEELNNTARD